MEERAENVEREVEVDVEFEAWFLTAISHVENTKYDDFKCLAEEAWKASHKRAYRVGYQTGYQTGYEAGYEIGYDVGIEVGKELEQWGNE